MSSNATRCHSTEEEQRNITANPQASTDSPHSTDQKSKNIVLPIDSSEQQQQRSSADKSNLISESNESNEIDQRSVTIRDFQPVNSWKIDTNDPIKMKKINFPLFTSYKSSNNERVERHVIDQSTGKKYLNESKHILRLKCLFLALGTPIVHLIGTMVTVAYKIARLVTFSHFWEKKEGEKSYSFKERAKDAGKDLLRVAASPIVIASLELAAIYGMVKPYDGRKLYASIERAMYGGSLLAPCFQPQAEEHLFGGDINKQNSW